LIASRRIHPERDRSRGEPAPVPQQQHWQVQDSFSYFKAPRLEVRVDVRRLEVRELFNPPSAAGWSTPPPALRGTTFADVATITGPVPGGTDIVSYGWNDLFLFRPGRLEVSNTFPLNLRRGATSCPGNWIDSLQDLTRRSWTAAGGGRALRVTPGAEERHQQHPARVGFTGTRGRAKTACWAPDRGGPPGRRGGYARTN